ncbi:MAG TPA: PASTA domain-containing protein [Firmicutes bacterium]|nr:PASTA domain-containing protein [Candidatus Fermentithermobacillaceae bacterium]
MGAVLARKRVARVLAGVAIAFVLLFARLIYIQFVWSDTLGEEALDMRMQDIPIQPRRGVIYDRNGHELAFSIDVESVYAIPAQVKDPEKTASILSEILGMSYDSLMARLTRHSSFEWIKRKIPDEVARRIREERLPGIGFTQESMRVWPKGSLLAQTLGIVGIDNDGLEGLEYQYDRQLKGIQGQFTVEVDALGEALPQSQKGYIPPVQGKNLILTIDEVVQFIAERELDAAVQRSQALGGLAIAMDPQTGEILAMAMRPTYDPNEYDRYPDANRRIITITDSYPPGSTFKPITAAAALETGKVSVNDTFFCGGSTRVGSEVLRCHVAEGHGSQTFNEVIQNSCNVGFIEIGLRTGVEDFYKYLDLFGVTTVTGIDLPGESSGIIVPEELCKPIDLAVMSFGQTLQLTPVQLIASISAIANGGYTVVPHVVKAVTDVDGNTVEVKSSGKIHQIISEKTSKELRVALEEVVSKGTGKQAYVPGYRLAGKTGTSNKVINGVLAEGKYLAWFIGFAPANDPKIALLIMIDEPKGAYYGGQIAAPVFQAIMRDVLRYLEVPPQEEAPGTDLAELVRVPDLVGSEVTSAQVELRKAELVGSKEGPGTRVTRQFPVAGAKVPKGTTVILYTEEDVTPGEGEVAVPSLMGMGLTQARQRLMEAGLILSAQGSGFAVSQDPPAGTIVPLGTAVKVVFRMDVGQ